MRRLLLFFAFLLACVPAYAATLTNGGAIFEIRSTGASSGGGCYYAGLGGTDYTQQDAAQFNGTNLVVDGTTNTKVTSATHNFVASDVGNCIHITAGTGWTAGFYEIVSAASNAATLDRSPAATGTTGGTWAEGGAYNEPIAAAAALGNGCGGTGLPNTLWLKAATYTITVNFVINTGGISNPSCPMAQVSGYTTTRGDGGVATITTATNSVVPIMLGATAASGGAGYLFQNLIVQSTAATRGQCVYEGAASANYGGVGFENVVFDGCAGVIGNASVNFSLSGYMHHVEFKNGPGTSYYLDTNGAWELYDVYFKGGGAAAIHYQPNAGQTGPIVCDHCVFNATVGGISVAFNNSANNLYQLVVRNSDFYNCTADAIVRTTGVPAYVLENDVFVGTTGYALNDTVVQPWTFRAVDNAFYNNSSGNLRAQSGQGNITLTGSPFTSPAGDDFSLNGTAGAGAALKAAGFPGTSFAGVGHMDVGALQSAGGGGGGGAGQIIGGM